MEYANTDKAGAGARLKVLALFWASFIALYTLRSVFMGYEHQFAALTRRSGVALVGMALAWLIMQLLDRVAAWPLRRRFALAVLASAPAALLFSVTSFTVFNVLAPMPGETCANGLACTPHAILVGISEPVISWFFVFVAWSALQLSLDAERRASAHREAARLAELRALRYQVNPHFLFNVLNTLQALVSSGSNAEAERCIAEMGRFFRYSLAADPGADVLLADEVDMQLRYLDLEQRRFRGRMSVHTDVAPAAADLRVPALILQPLVENAVKHGIARSLAPVRIAIRAAVVARDTVLVEVEDDARAAAPGAAPGLGVGLKNVAERLALHFGRDARCEAHALPEGGFRVSLHLPLARA